MEAMTGEHTISAALARSAPREDDVLYTASRFARMEHIYYKYS